MLKKNSRIKKRKINDGKKRHKKGKIIEKNLTKRQKSI